MHEAVDSVSRRSHCISSAADQGGMRCRNCDDNRLSGELPASFTVMTQLENLCAPGSSQGRAQMPFLRTALTRRRTVWCVSRQASAKELSFWAHPLRVAYDALANHKHVLVRTLPPARELFGLCGFAPIERCMRTRLQRCSRVRASAARPLRCNSGSELLRIITNCVKQAALPAEVRVCWVRHSCRLR
jgi:hypothetical protein